MKHLFLLLTLVALVSCQKDGNTSSGNTARTVVVQPLGNFEASVAEDIVVAIRKVHPKVVLNAAIPLPPHSFYAPRNRYRADSIIRYLAGRAKDGSVVIGLAHTDISTTKNKVKDWGVMGLGYHPGAACVVSDFRLRKHHQENQLYKVVLHELGHTEGLPHCPKRSCIMRDAEGKIPLQEEKAFCSKCRSFLNDKRHWTIRD
ncbi:MAG TPA: matrixin family metalloprotease [Flavobacterium sp.]|nr:matrixin family metalloprotease [Flavobacterium sp.]